jgi:hypothetical protein
MKGVEVAGLSGMICVLESIVRPLLIMVMGSLYASPGLALFVTPFNPQNPVHGLLAAVNIMTFWVLAVRAIGLARLSGAGFGKAAAWVFGLWILEIGVLAGFGFAMQATFNR